MTAGRRRKRPPPLSRSAKPLPQPAPTEVVADVALRDGAICLIAETLYVATDVSLAQLVEVAPIKESGTHIRTLESWCRAGKWVVHRRQFRERWKARILAEIGNELAVARREQLRELNSLRAQALKQLASRKLKPRSYEGMVNAVCRLVLTVDHVQRGLLAELAPISAPRTVELGAPVAMRASLSEEEALAAAKAVVALRRHHGEQPTTSAESG
jgi:hypothetical protein